MGASLQCAETKTVRMQERAFWNCAREQRADAHSFVEILDNFGRDSVTCLALNLDRLSALYEAVMSALFGGCLKTRLGAKALWCRLTLSSVMVGADIQKSAPEVFGGCSRL